MNGSKHMCWETTIWLSTTTLKTRSQGVMLNAIKYLSVSSSSPIGFEVESHNSRSDKLYQSQGHGFESRECHCEGGIVGETTIWLPTITLKIGPRGVMSNAIKDLSVFSSSLIGFKVEWHSSWFGNMIFLTYDIQNIQLKKKKKNRWY